MRRIRISAEAREEYLKAIEWYEARWAGLGSEFDSACIGSIEAIAEDPGRNPHVGRGFHRVVMQRFPFAIFYEFTEEQIVIASVFHCARDPKLWKQRAAAKKRKT